MGQTPSPQHTDLFDPTSVRGIVPLCSLGWVRKPQSVCQIQPPVVSVNKILLATKLCPCIYILSTVTFVSQPQNYIMATEANGLTGKKTHLLSGSLQKVYQPLLKLEEKEEKKEERRPRKVMYVLMFLSHGSWSQVLGPLLSKNNSVECLHFIQEKDPDSLPSFTVL